MRAKLILLAVVSLIPVLIASSPDKDTRYLSPSEIAVSQDGRWLYVVCERSDELLVVDAHTQKVAKRVPIGHVPRGLSLSPDQKQIYVTSSWTDRIEVIDATSLTVVKELTTGFEPISVVADHSGSTLYVTNRISNDISVIDLATGKEQKRLLAGRGASNVAIEPGSNLVYATHVFPNIAVKYRTPPESEITVADTERKQVVDRKDLHNVAGVFHIAFSADGKLAAVAQLRPKNLIPLAHVEHGWVFGNSLSVFGEGFDGIVQVPLDELERYYAMPFGVAIAPDHSRIYVSSAGSDMVSVLDVARLARFAKTHKSFANDLSASSNYVMARIPVGKNPRGITLSPDGHRLYVANRMDDTIAVIDTAKNQVLSTIELGGPKEVTPIRRGEQIFNTAKFGFQGHFGCANCHIDGTFDGLEWDLEPDGFGKDIVDNKLIEDLFGTEPFKWNGGNPNMPTECGPRTEKYFYRSQSYNDQELTDLVTFVMAQPFRPNRYRLPNGELTPAQERGKEIFERTVDKTGKPIPENNQCAFCHSGPKYTNKQLFDVGSGKPTDRSPLIDTPQLKNVHMTAPYLHDGSARSLEEIWTVFNPNDTHGRTNDLTKDELNDLIEYLRTL
ncbi:MAG: beta-propeller fold lactonase family protein [Acidobacteriaceae bacterium]